MLKRLMIVGILVGLTGCGSISKEFQNKLACTPSGEAYLISMYGPLGVASKIDVQNACKGETQ